MKKNFFYALGMAAMLCGCSSGSVEEDGNRMSATGFVGGLGNATASVSYYNFKEEDPGCQISGFSVPENFGRWTNEEYPAITFENITPNSDLTAKISVTNTVPGGDATKYEVYANEQKIGEGETYPGVIYVNVPAEAVGDNDNLTLMFKMLNPKRPIDVNPEIYDSRLLGMGISNITLYGVSVDEEETEEESEE